MSQDIIHETVFFLHSVLTGAVIAFVYDWFLIARKLIKHGSLWISIEDFIFWLLCAFGVFYMLYRENNGVLRWFTIIGAMFGMICYKCMISRLFINIMSTCIHKIMWVLFRIIQVVVKPIKWLFSRMGKLTAHTNKKVKKYQNYVKNRLTVCIKMIRMVLCKH